jgi:hypothetical protein
MTIKINNKNEKYAFILCYVWKDSGIVYFILTYH